METRLKSDVSCRYDVRLNQLSERPHSYEDSGDIDLDEAADGVIADEASRSPESGYRQGDALSTVYDRDRAVFGLLSLPSNAMNGDCLAAAPVKFLVPFTSACRRVIDSEEACEQAAGGYLDPSSYRYTKYFWLHALTFLPTAKP